MIELNNKEWDLFHNIKEKVIEDLIKDLKNLELPKDWSSQDIFNFVLNILERYKRNI